MGVSAWSIEVSGALCFFLKPRAAMSAREPRISIMVVAVSMVLSTGARTQEGFQRISEANLKHGRQTKDELKAQRHAGKVGIPYHFLPGFCQ